MRARPRRGSAFIEVLIGLVLLAVSGTALITLMGQTARTLEQLRLTETQTRAAGLELGAFAILNRAELAQRVGATRVHGWSIRVSRTSDALFDVVIATSDTGMVLLRTTLYRPDTATNANP